METEFQDFEEDVFVNLDASRVVSASGNYTLDPVINANEASRLNGADTLRRVGPGKLLSVTNGDQVEIEVFARYDGSPSDNSALSQSAIITAIAATFGGVNGGNTEQQSIYNLFNSNASLLPIGSEGNSALPRAYLNYIMFDQDFNYIDAGFRQVSSSANGYHEKLSFQPLHVTKGGYVYVYVSNETSGAFNVFFDDLRITHTKGKVMQEDHYYPFGMNISALSSTSPLSKPNRYKLSSNEEQVDFDFSVYDFNARTFDPILGRFMQIDPMSEKREWLNPYNYVQNNPMLRIDPAGTFDWVRNQETGGYEWKNEVTSESNTPKGYEYVGKNDSDVVKDIYGSTSESTSDIDVGLIRAEDFNNSYSAKGVAFHNASAKTKLSVNLSADVETQYNTDGSIQSKEFKGVNVSATVTSDIGPGYQGVSYSLRTESMSLNGNKMGGLDLSKGPMLLPGPGAGGVPAKAFSGRIDASSINSGGSNAVNANFKGLVMTGKASYMSFPGALGLAGTPNYTNLSVTIRKDE